MTGARGRRKPALEEAAHAAKRPSGDGDPNRVYGQSNVNIDAWIEHTPAWPSPALNMRGDVHPPGQPTVPLLVSSTAVATARSRAGASSMSQGGAHPDRRLVTRLGGAATPSVRHPMRAVETMPLIGRTSRPCSQVW